MDGEHWYALTVKPRHDKASAGILAAKGYPTLLPTYKKRHRYASRIKESELPLFPGYVFCHFNVVVRLPILATPGVLGIVNIGGSPAPIDPDEIDSLKKAMATGFPMGPYPFLKSGQRVRIREGSLRGIEGVIMRVRPRVALVLSVTLLQHSVVLEVDEDATAFIEPVGGMKVAGALT